MFKTGSAAEVALALAVTAFAPAANAETITARVTAEIVAPAEITMAAATERLIGDSPGVFTLRIPGAATVGTIELTVSTEKGSGTVVFSGSGESVDTWRKANERIAMSAQLAPRGIYQMSEIATRGIINGQGMQVIVMKASQNGDGSGAVVAIITFD